MTAEIRRTSPLAAHVDALRELGAREVALASQVSVRVDPARTNLALPQTPNAWVTWGAVDDREVLWLGPDEWLVVSETIPAETVVADLEVGLAGDHHSLVDVSAGRVVIELGGSDRANPLAAGCGLDLHPRSWRDGMCAQTLLANVAVLLQERADVTRVFLRPSFAGHLVAWLRSVAPPR